MDEQYTGYLEDTSEDAEHYGTPRHSGRYPWGSGKNPQRNKNFLSRARDLQKQGLSSTEIARAFNMSTTQYRALYSSAKDAEKADMILQVKKLKEKGMSNIAIGERFGIPESTVRNYLKDDFQQRTNATRNLADMLKEQVESKPYLDIGKGVNRQLGNVSDTQLKTAVEMLKLEGYKTYEIKVEQATNPKQYTIVKVLTKDDVTKKEVFDNRGQITSPEGVFIKDFGTEIHHIQKPVSLDSNRVGIRYAEDGGADKDGVIEIRKGVEDLTLGQYRYGQVRIAVDDTHYLKGMAVYSDAKDWPKGVDIMFNTNKTKDTPKMSFDKDNTVLKLIKMDKNDPTAYKTPENPFGAITEQFDYYDKNGNAHQSPINYVNTDKDWDKWKKTLSSQFLSKQPVMTAKQQLDVTYRQKEDEFNEIMSLTNPTIKRKLLESFAEDCDSAAVHLKAAAFPRQAAHVILPITSLKDDEVYAPNYKQGEEVILVRYPHEGVFQIPRLKVNNNNPEGKSILGQAPHAIGINAHVAEQLSGADFDGDTVAVIPTVGQKFKTSKVLDGLKDFDPKRAYPAHEGMTHVGDDGFNKQREMGIASNLISDMTIKGANEEQIVRAVRYSMTVIDAEKHNLDWKLSYKDNRIKELKNEFQDGGGASTLISRAKGEARIPERKELVSTKQMTPEEKERYLNGERIFRNTDEYHTTYKKVNGKIPIDENGKKIWIETGKKPNMMTVTNMEAVSDAHELSSGRLIEEVYADHANRMKALANRARKEYLATGRLQQNASAKETYAQEVKELKAALNIAAKNAPYERQAQALANAIMAAKIKEHEDDWDDDDIKRQRQLTIKQTRLRVGSQSRKDLGIKISDRQWEAIQAGAISDSMLSEILRYTDTAEIQKRATPRTAREFSSAAKARARTLLNMGYTQAQVAEELGVSVSTINKEVNGR